MGSKVRVKDSQLVRQHFILPRRKISKYNKASSRGTSFSDSYSQVAIPDGLARCNDVKVNADADRGTSSQVGSRESGFLSSHNLGHTNVFGIRLSSAASKLTASPRRCATGDAQDAGGSDEEILEQHCFRPKVRGSDLKCSAEVDDEKKLETRLVARGHSRCLYKSHEGLLSCSCPVPIWKLGNDEEYF